MGKSNIVNVVLGGAGGMGIEICKSFSGDEYIFVVDIDEEKLKRAEDILSDSGVENAKYIRCDISSKEQVQKLANQVQRTGNLGNVVNAAAYAPVQAEARRILDVNAVGVVNIIDVFYPLISLESALTTIGSIAGYMLELSDEIKEVFDSPYDDEFLEKMLEIADEEASMAYPLSKLFCIYYTKRNVSRWAKKGARINTVSAGCFTTPMGLADMEGGRFVIESTPMNRWGHPKEIASVVKFISSKEASYITGADILVDGGYNAKSNHEQYEQVIC